MLTNPFQQILLALFTSSIALAQSPETRPHILLMVSDDMGWNDVGYHGGPIETPSIDRLVAEGMELDRFYVHPICSPTRTALMTGRSPGRFGINGPLGKGAAGVPLDEHFLPETFRQAGYRTALVGKWHLGSATDEYKPLSRGFDHFYGFLEGFIDYYTHEHAKTLDWQRNGELLKEEGYSTDLFASEAIRLIESQPANQPLFLYLAFNAPHGPNQAPTELVQKYEATSDRRKSKSAARFASIEAMDLAVGRILASLEAQEMAENTLVLFFCDNGAKATGPKGAPVRGSLTLQGGKSSLQEGGIRVPAVLRWPRVVPAGSRSELMVAVQDLLPTLAAAAGIESGAEKPLDGANVWLLLKSGDSASGRPPILITGGGGQYTVLQSPYKLLQEGDDASLYHIMNDPRESKDIAAANPDRVDELQASVAPVIQGMPAARRVGKKQKRERI